MKNTVGRNNVPLALLSFIAIFWMSCSSPKVNFRFALIKENYKSVDHADRLKTDKTEVTSTYFQMEGPAWENENIAFRNYFDERNGIDIFGKKTHKMVLDSVGIAQNYHEMQTWGMDILKVGNSLGAGAIGLIIGDTLYRIGPNADADFKLLEKSKRRIAFELNFYNWRVQDRVYNVTHTISMKAGTHYYQNEVKILGLVGDEKLAVGIVDHIPNINLIKTGNSVVAYTHGKQTMQNEILGMGISTDPNQFISVEHSDKFKSDVNHTHIIELKLSESQHSATWRFFAGWELGDASFENPSNFRNIMMSESQYDQKCPSGL